MSPHDVLMSKFIELRNLLREYVEEFEPSYADPALDAFEKSMFLADKFPEDDQ